MSDPKPGLSQKDSEKLVEIMKEYFKETHDDAVEEGLLS